MNKYIICILVLSLFVCIPLISSAQQISNVNARLSGETVIISYDLVGTKVGQKFRIELLSSADDYQSPLQNVTGDVGENQLGGSGKQIEWNAKEELGVYSGNITFEVRSTITFNPIQLTSPNASSSFKPGKNLPIIWNGGTSNSTLQLDLLKTNTLSKSIGTTSNSGSYNWSVPKDVSKGGDYQIKMYDINDRANTEITSSMFQIKGKGGAAKILIPVLAAGAVVGVLLALSGGEEDPQGPGTTDNNDLPSPPDPNGGSARIKTGATIFSLPLFGN